jgi:ferric-dicitrate binding protein FerR (iron transport regulator)
MDRPTFISLLQRYLDNSCTPGEKQLIDHWYELLNQEEELTDDLSQPELEEKLWERIQQEFNPEIQTRVISQPGRWWQGNTLRWLAAASVVLVTGLFYFSSIRPQLTIGESGLEAGINAEEYVETNTSTKSRWVLLEDSSRIFLGPGSSLRFATPFAAQQRKVSLTGSAFFDVKKNTSRPFLVYTGDIVTRVVGTCFSIRTGTNNLEVAVVSGKVIVEKNEKQEGILPASGGDGVVLTPNQKVTYFSDNKYFVTGLVENPILVGKPSQPTSEVTPFKFEETPLKKVLETIQNAYGLEITLVNEDIKNCPITADLTQQDLYTQLNTLCASLRATLKIRGTNIIITEGSCY